MANLLPFDLDAAILAALARRPQSVTVGLLMEALPKPLSRRTLHRHLGPLVRSGQVAAEGNSRARRYRLSSTALAATDIDEPYVTLSSPQSHEIRAYVRHAISDREPVGYDRKFLEGYKPNRSFYLSSELREHLGAIGTVSSKQRPAGTYARDILARLLIDLSWASSRLEGNTYSRLDTKKLIEHGESAEGKDRLETQMILNHKSAIEMLVDEAATIAIDAFTLRNLHGILSENLLTDPVQSGRVRTQLVQITGSVYQPLGIPQQVQALFDTLLDKAAAIDDPFEQSFFVMVHVPYLQPFVDVNKRVSRLAANIPLIKHNLVPLSFVDVPERGYVDGTLGVYELRQVALLRDVFVWAYERSCKQYVVIKSSIAEPDAVRLAHRTALSSVVGDLVRSLAKPSRSVVERLAKSLVPTTDRRHFVDLVLEDLQNLHEGNVARYRLRLSEYLAWVPIRDRARK